MDERGELERRRQIIAMKLRQLKNDVEHWNEMHPGEEIDIDFNLTKDIERLRADDRRTT